MLRTSTGCGMWVVGEDLKRLGVLHIQSQQEPTAGVLCWQTELGIAGRLSWVLLALQGRLLALQGRLLAAVLTLLYGHANTVPCLAHASVHPCRWI